MPEPAARTTAIGLTRRPPIVSRGGASRRRATATVRRRGPVLPHDAEGRHLCQHADCAGRPGYAKPRNVFVHARSHGDTYYAQFVQEYSTLTPPERQCPHCPKNDFFGLSGKRNHIRQAHPGEKTRG